MGGVFQAGGINLASLNSNGTYVVIQTPVNTTIQGVQTGIEGCVGSAAWGPLNAAITLGGAADAVRAFGLPDLAATDMPTDLDILFSLLVPTVVGVRVTDGTDAKASAALNTAAFGTVTIAGVYHNGDIITVTVGGVATAYTVVAGDTNLAGVTASVVNALNGNLAFAAIARAFYTGLVITIQSVNASNATTLTAAVTGAGATITATASGATLAGGGTAIGTAQARWTGKVGNGLTLTFAPNNASTPAAPLWDAVVAVTMSANGNILFGDSERFTALPEATLATALQSALANGQGAARGPSAWMRFVPAAGVTAPVSLAVALSGGLNGDTSVTTGQQLGTNQAIPMTGVHALNGTGAQVIHLCGNTDSTAWTSLVAAGIEIGAYMQLGMAPNMTTAAAIAAKKAAGVDEWHAKVNKDWVQYLDTVNNVLRLVPPQVWIAARMASLSPEQSSGNKQIARIVATERTLSGIPYTDTELGQLQDAGITVIWNPSPGGSYFAARAGLNSSSNAAVKDDGYTRMTNFLAYSFVGAFGEFIDALQTARQGDPTRAAAKNKLVRFLSGLKGADMIEDFSVDMSFGDSAINTPQSVIDGFMKALVKVKYKATIRFFVVTLIGGKTVDVSSAAG